MNDFDFNAIREDSEKINLSSNLKQTFGFKFNKHKSVGEKDLKLSEVEINDQDTKKEELLFRYKLGVSYCKLLASHEKLLKTDDDPEDEDESKKGPNYLK